MPTPTSLPRFSEQQEAALFRFDASWNNPGVQQLRAEYASEADEVYLLELNRIDAQKRIAAGMTADEAMYLEAFPMLQNDAALLQKVRAISFIPMQTGDSVLRALVATTPVLQQVNLPAIDPNATTSEAPSTLPEHRYKLEGEIRKLGFRLLFRCLVCRGSRRREEAIILMYPSITPPFRNTGFNDGEAPLYLFVIARCSQ